MSFPAPLDTSLNAILSTALDAAIAMDESGAIVGWNAVAERTFGWSVEEVIGKSVADVVIPLEHRKTHNKGLKQYLRTRVPKLLGRHVEVLAAHRSGRHFQAELSTTEITYGGRRLFVGFVRDISERKALEIQMADVTDRLKLAVRTHAIGIFDTDVLRRRVSWNEELEAIYGYKPGCFETTLDAWRKHVLPADLKRIDRRFSTAIFAKTLEVSYNYGIIRHDGVTRYLEASAFFFYDDVGNNIRRVGVNIDVTDRKRMERELSNSQSELDHLSRLNSLGAMASSLGHELNQPLAAIVNYLGAAKVLLGDRSQEPGDTVIRAIEAASASAIRAGDIIRRLREISLKRTILRRKTTLTEILIETIPLALETDGQAGLDVELEINPEGDTVYADPTLLQQVLFNLMRNSVQAMSKTGGRITIRAKPYLLMRFWLK